MGHCFLSFFYKSSVVHMGILKSEFTDPRHVGGGLAQLCVRVGSHRCETPTLTGLVQDKVFR